MVKIRLTRSQIGVAKEAMHEAGYRQIAVWARDVLLQKSGLGYEDELR